MNGDMGRKLEGQQECLDWADRLAQTLASLVAYKQPDEETYDLLVEYREWRNRRG